MATIVILTSDPADRPPGIESLDQRSTVVYADSTELADVIGDADALLLWDYFSTVVRDVWDSATRLSWIHIAAAGVDKLLFKELVESEVVVTNARGTFDQPIAEYVLACVLAHAKLLRESYLLQDARVWRQRESRLIAGANVLVVGTGSIGRAVGRTLAAVGMRVRGAARSARADDPDFESVLRSDQLVDHVGWADYVVVATPLTDRTRGLIGAEVLAAMRHGAYLINIGRGPCVDEKALIARLADDRFGGAALDVFETEPLPPQHPFWGSERVFVSPHMSGDVAGWRETLARQFMGNANLWLAGEPLDFVIDKRRGFAR
jgi:phosphoglycerate dehydrogenase-like enzyme